MHNHVLSIVLFVVVHGVVDQEDPVVQGLVGCRGGRGGWCVLLEVVSPLGKVGGRWAQHNSNTHVNSRSTGRDLDDCPRHKNDTMHSSFFFFSFFFFLNCYHEPSGSTRQSHSGSGHLAPDQSGSFRERSNVDHRCTC